MITLKSKLCQYLHLRPITFADVLKNKYPLNKKMLTNQLFLHSILRQRLFDLGLLLRHSTLKACKIHFVFLERLKQNIARGSCNVSIRLFKKTKCILRAFKVKISLLGIKAKCFIIKNWFFRVVSVF